MTRSRLDGEPPHLSNVRGIYIDLSGEGPAGMRLSWVECCNGKIVMTPVGGSGPNVSQLIGHIGAEDWLDFVERLHGGERKTA